MSEPNHREPRTLVDQRIINVMVRMPAAMHRRLQQQAAKQRRSANRQVLAYLDQVPELAGKP